MPEITRKSLIGTSIEEIRRRADGQRLLRIQVFGSLLRFNNSRRCNEMFVRAFRSKRN